jgi:post-segregation antitoxin (ccd killing protein)
MERGDGPVRRPVNFLLRQDVVREARRHTTNLSDTVETLSQDLVAERRAQDAAKQARIEAAIDMLNQHYEKYGLIGEECIPL